MFCRDPKRETDCWATDLIQHARLHCVRQGGSPVGTKNQHNNNKIIKTNRRRRRKGGIVWAWVRISTRQNTTHGMNQAAQQCHTRHGPSSTAMPRTAWTKQHSNATHGMNQAAQQWHAWHESITSGLLGDSQVSMTT